MNDPVAPTALAYFSRIAELGSFTAAARDLHVSQPSLSIAVQKLEEQLDTRLFLRGRRGVTLTRTGEVLLRHARQVLRAVALAREEIQGLEDQPKGRFCLGCHPSLGAYLLPGFMAQFLRKYPGIDLTLFNGNSREVEEAVVERAVDVGLVVNPRGHPDCVVVPLFKDRVSFVVSAALRARAEPDLIESHPLLYVPALAQVQYLLAALSQGDPARRLLACSSLELVKSLVLDGVGPGILPLRVARHGVASGRIVLLSPALPHYEDTITLVRRADMHPTRAASLLVEALRAHGRAMPPVAAS